jgi:hypothetical protein
MTEVPVKYVVRIREEENDARTERQHTYLVEADAEALAAQAEEHGFHAVVLKVLDIKRLERV